MRLTFAAALLLIALAAHPETPTPRDADDKPCVLVTGANRGLGLEFAKQYAAAGWHVIGTARNPDGAQELAATGADVVALDVAEAGSVDRLVATLEGRPIDLLINNAGVGARIPSVEGLDAERVERVLAVNLVGPMRVTSALLPNLRKGERKKIVSITSGLGSIENNRGGGYYGYRESKAGLNMFMRSISAELAPEGFACVTLSPGWVRTDMGGANAPLSPEESITGMRAVIADLTVENTGRFLGHDGTVLPW